MRHSFAVLVVVALGLAFAQPGLSQVDLGVRGGLSYSHLTGENISTDSKTGFIGGVFGRFGLVENLGLRAEVAYIQKGAQATSEIFDPVEGQITIERADNLAYLELLVPLDLAIRVKNEKVRPRLWAGPTLALALSCSIEISSQGASGDSEDCKDDITNYDAGLVLGVGFEYGAGPGKFVADLRYDIGFVDISGSESAGETQVTTKNRSLQLLVGYVRRLGGARED